MLVYPEDFVAVSIAEQYLTAWPRSGHRVRYQTMPYEI